MTAAQRDFIVRRPKIWHDASVPGLSGQQILAEQPTFTVEGVRAAAAYGADLARHESPP